MEGSHDQQQGQHTDDDRRLLSSQTTKRSKITAVPNSHHVKDIQVHSHGHDQSYSNNNNHATTSTALVDHAHVQDAVSSDSLLLSMAAELQCMIASYLGITELFSLMCSSKTLQQTFVHQMVYIDVSRLKSKNAVNDATIQNIVSLCPNTIKLNLSGCSRITDKSMDHLLRLTNLQHLDLSVCRSITHQGLSKLSQGNHTLQSLTLSMCAGIQSLGFLHAFTRLSSLNVSHWRNELTEDALHEVGTLKGLKALSLDCRELQDDNFTSLVDQMRDLQVLDMSQVYSLTDVSCSAIAKFNSLKKLKISGLQKITPQGIALLKALVNLELEIEEL